MLLKSAWPLKIVRTDLHNAWVMRNNLERINVIGEEKDLRSSLPHVERLFLCAIKGVLKRNKSKVKFEDLK